MKVSIGKTENGAKLELDIPRLLETRMLICANSGGGKSITGRKIMEATHGEVQQIIFDLEGEFVTLREKFDYILAGKDGDIPAEIRSAEVLAKKILEMGTSVIIDLSELRHQERLHYVRLFIDAMIDAPKELWHPTLVFVDEAHQFCPEKGDAESASAVNDLLTRGRKRGYCAVLMTQRISKLAKDAEAECNNKAYGRTGLDIDMKRVADDLGFTTKDQTRSLRDLEPGEFYLFGPAITRSVTKAKIDWVETTPPKLGQRALKSVPKPTPEILKALAKLTDLPQEAERELKDKRQMTERIRELERQVRAATHPHLDRPQADALARASEERGRTRGLAEGAKQAAAQVKAFSTENARLAGLLARIRAQIPENYAPLATLKIETPRQIPPRIVVPALVPRYPLVSAPRREEGDRGPLGKCEREILRALSLRPGKIFSKAQTGALSGYSPRSGSFSQALAGLNARPCSLLDFAAMGDAFVKRHSKCLEPNEVRK